MSRSMRRFRLLALIVFGSALLLFSIWDLFDLVRGRAIPGGVLSLVAVSLVRILGLYLMFRVGRRDLRFLKKGDV